ncbi:MAG: prenyltransferase/squalene oxidase repeat-containing protein [Verrucomicrobiota bacterium]
MKSCILFLAAAVLSFSGLRAAPECAEDELLIRNAANLSIRNEVKMAIEKGSSFLIARQKPDGSWPGQANPGITALPLIALQNLPHRKDRNDKRETMRRGYDFLRKSVKPDGGIYTTSNCQENTALCVTALLGADEPKDEALLRAARRFLIRGQIQNAALPAVEGRFNESSGGEPATLYTTACVVEALAGFNAMHPARESDVNWQAAIDFIIHRQNLRSHSKELRAGDGRLNEGGFGCSPGDSTAGGTQVHGSLPGDVTMSYCGLLGLLQAGIPRNDTRIAAMLDWLAGHFTLEEDPAIQRSGLYFYYYCVAKGLASARLNHLTLPDGSRVNWAAELALKLINSQNIDGSWSNASGPDAALVTSYSLIALEIVYYQL